jgi:hypothetical protein
MIKRTRIMYIESKAESLNGPARIGRVTFNKTGRTLYYKGQSFQSLKGHGFKATTAKLRPGKSTGFQVRVVMDWTVSTGGVR